jgi:hypothetical protein
MDNRAFVIVNSAGQINPPNPPATSGSFLVEYVILKPDGTSPQPPGAPVQLYVNFSWINVHVREVVKAAIRANESDPTLDVVFVF